MVGDNVVPEGYIIYIYIYIVYYFSFESDVVADLIKTSNNAISVLKIT